MSEHTPTPWAAFEDETEEGFNIVAVVPHTALVYRTTGGHKDDANAEFIVRAVNAHDDLVRAVKAFCDCLAFSPSTVPGAIETDLELAYKLGVDALSKT